MSRDRFESLQVKGPKQYTQIQQTLETGSRPGDAAATFPPVLYVVINGQRNTETDRNSILALKRVEEARKSEVRSPFDGALEVGLADCAVVYEYRRTGAELFGQSSRRDLRVMRSIKGSYLGYHTNDASQSVYERLRGSCNCFSSSPALKSKEKMRR